MVSGNPEIQSGIRQADSQTFSAALSSAAVHRAPDGAPWGWDEITQTKLWSRKAKAIFGLPADADITHDLFVSLLQPGDVSIYRTAWAAALDPAGTGTYTLEYRIRRANDGHERWIDSTATVEFDKGRPIRVVGTLRDVTDEKHAALRSNRTERGKTAFATSPGFGELPVTPLPAGPDAVPANVLAFETASGIHPVADLFRTALQSLPLHIAVLDGAGTVVLVNKPWTDSAGYTGDRLSATMTVGANFRDVCRQSTASTPDAERVLSGIEGVLNGTLPRFEMEYAFQGPVEQQWYTMTAAPLPASGGAIVSHDCITDRKRADRAVQASEVLFRATFDTAAVGMAHLTPDRRLLRANPQLCLLLGYDHSELCAMSTFQQIVHPDDRDIGVAHVEMMRAGGADTCRWQQRLLRKDGSVVWVMTGLGAVRQPSGALDYLVASVEDVSSLKLAEQRQDTLLHELAHRGKNLLSVIQAIANCSLSGERTLKDAKTVLIGRLQALATSYDTLTKVAFDGVLLDVILRNELRSFGGRVHIAGPPVKLTDKATQTIALIAHELATNAAKYGALSVPDGRLDITWQLVDAAHRLHFVWREQAGPPVKAPERRGFGTTLIIEVAGAEFSCIPAVTYDSQGVTYEFDAPLDRLGTVVTDTALRADLRHPVVCSLYDAWCAQCPPHGLPQLEGFDWSRFAATGALTIATIAHDGSAHFAQMDHALAGRMTGSVAQNSDAVGDSPAELAKAYAACAAQGEPFHERMHIDFGEGDPFTFERLLVPFSIIGGKAATHVVGIVVSASYSPGA